MDPHLKSCLAVLAGGETEPAEKAGKDRVVSPIVGLVSIPAIFHLYRMLGANELIISGFSCGVNRYIKAYVAQ